MAESIVRLRVESQEFENKLKRASQELLAMADNARRTGATFAIADKEELAFVSSLGQLQTSARSAKGQISEMTKAFQDLSMHYKTLTDEEKASPYGQELEKSLRQLQDRINESKQSLTEINANIGESKGTTDSLSASVQELTGMLGLNIPKLGAMSMAIGAVTAAANVAKDAFFNNEQQLDEWGRVTESCKSVYNGFLDALNTGDISGYLQRINQIVDAARKAYDALDELGTYNAFNQVNVARDRQRLTNAMADYREGKATKEEVRTASQAVITNLKEKYKKEDSAYVAFVNKLAAERGISGEYLLKIANGSYADFKKAQSVPMTGTEYKVITTPSGFQYAQTVPKAANQKEANAAALRRINDTDWQELQQRGALRENTRNEMGQVRRQVTRILGGSMASSRTDGEASRYRVPTTMSSNILDTSKIAFKIDENFDGGKLYDELNGELSQEVAEALTDVIKSEVQSIDPEQLKVLLQGNTSTNLLQNIEMNPAMPYNQKQKNARDEGKEISKAAQSLGAMNNILSALQNMGIKLPEGLMKTVGMVQSLISVIQSIQSVVEMFATSSQAANTIATTANTTALVAMTGALTANSMVSIIPFNTGGIVGNSAGIPHRFAGGGIVNNYSIGGSVQRFANGGMVRHIHNYAANGFIGGNNFSGDLIPIAVNSGELILNRAQQGNLASQLTDGSALTTMRIEKIITGEDIRLVLNNNKRRRSRGELL